MYRIEAVVRDGTLGITLIAPAGTRPRLDLAPGYVDGGEAVFQPCDLNVSAEEAGEPATARFVASFALPDPNAPSPGRIEAIGFRISDDTGPIAPAEIDATGWQVGTLHVPDRSVFNQVMRYTFQRVSDPETLFYISLNTARDSGVELRIRITSFVVFCYRGIELERHEILGAATDLFDEFEARFDELERFTAGSVREVGEQVILSLLSVQWHVLIALREYAGALAVMQQILERGRDNPQYHHLPFATNYANAAVLVTFVHFRQDRPLGAPDPVMDFYQQFRAIMANLPETIPPFNYLREFQPVLDLMAMSSDIGWLLSDSTRAALRLPEPDVEAQRRRAFADKKYTPQRILRLCTRVRDVASFDAAFLEFCDTVSL